MSQENSLAEVDRDVTPETRIWQAVILHTVEEWINGPFRLSVQAESYLFSDNTDFPAVCQSAGMDAGRLRTRLSRIRDRVARSGRSLAIA